MHNLFWSLSDTEPNFVDYEKENENEKEKNKKTMIYKTEYNPKEFNNIKGVIKIKPIDFYKNNNIIKKIEETLDEWDEYGYLYYIGEGTCPPSNQEIPSLSSIYSPSSNNVDTTSTKKTKGERRQTHKRKHTPVFSRSASNSQTERKRPRSHSSATHTQPSSFIHSRTTRNSLTTTGQHPRTVKRRRKSML